MKSYLGTTKSPPRTLSLQSCHLCLSRGQPDDPLPTRSQTIQATGLCYNTSSDAVAAPPQHRMRRSSRPLGEPRDKRA